MPIVPGMRIILIWAGSAPDPPNPTPKKRKTTISSPQTEGVIMAYDVYEYIRKCLIQKRK